MGAYWHNYFPQHHTTTLRAEVKDANARLLIFPLLVITRYKKRKDDFDRVKYCARWRVLNRFQQLVDEECKGRSTRLYGGDRALYEMLFRAEPRKVCTWFRLLGWRLPYQCHCPHHFSQYIHRHRFLTVMRDVYGFDIAPSDHVGNLEALRVLNLVFETFDLDGCDQVDWRLVGLALFSYLTAS